VPVQAFIASRLDLASDWSIWALALTRTASAAMPAVFSWGTLLLFSSYCLGQCLQKLLTASESLGPDSYHVLLTFLLN
jgi:hypothetical protein